MAITHSHKARHVRSQRYRHIQLICTIACASAGAVIQSIAGQYIKTPRNNSTLSCSQWVKELLDGHRDRFRDSLGLNKHVFKKLLSELQKRSGLCNTKYLLAEEQLAIFLYICTTGLSNRKAQERVQRSADTISKLFYFFA